MKNEGGNLFLITALVIGLGLGLGISLGISPFQMRNVSPSQLSAEDRDAYRVLIAQAFDANGDLGRATARLGLLQDEDPRQALAEQAQKAIAQGRPAGEARSLALLAAALGLSEATPTGTVLPTEPMMTLPPSSPAATGTPSAGLIQPPPLEPSLEPTALIESTYQLPTPLPTAPPSRTYTILQRENICDVEQRQMIDVTVQDAAGNPIPGAGITISWEGGQETFFTGLKPRSGLGFADYRMEPDVVYNLRMAEGGQTATNLQGINCRTDAGMDYKGGVTLVFSATE